MSVARFREAAGAREALPEEDTGAYHTLGGLAMTVLRRVPQAGQAFKAGAMRFEVVDMDRATGSTSC